ncbi:unknown protein [Cronobacter turicensis z3032]|uniref:Uncharacterized protein n=1 Tax=Cronobacter turicensis (strain DSM 18703 / CCUG 55852 / LMG 23827 / z3032) TaxID=693216 RepID=C9XU95_CROTZ|nr:unknown protein [Cronobacter turicensis z3032]
MPPFSFCFTLLLHATNLSICALSGVPLICCLNVKIKLNKCI